jgi:hypothetical protein
MIDYINHNKETIKLDSGMLVPYSKSIESHHTIESGWNRDFVIHYINKHINDVSEGEYIVVERISQRISIMKFCETRADAIEVAKKLGAKKTLNAGTGGWEQTSCWGAFIELLLR